MDKSSNSDTVIYPGNLIIHHTLSPECTSFASQILFEICFSFCTLTR